MQSAVSTCLNPLELPRNPAHGERVCRRGAESGEGEGDAVGPEGPLPPHRVEE